MAMERKDVRVLWTRVRKRRRRVATGSSSSFFSSCGTLSLGGSAAFWLEGDNRGAGVWGTSSSCTTVVRLLFRDVFELVFEDKGGFSELDACSVRVGASRE